MGLHFSQEDLLQVGGPQSNYLYYIYIYNSSCIARNIASQPGFEHIQDDQACTCQGLDMLLAFSLMSEAFPIALLTFERACQQSAGNNLLKLYFYHCVHVKVQCQTCDSTCACMHMQLHARTLKY